MSEKSKKEKAVTKNCFFFFKYVKIIKTQNSQTYNFLKQGTKAATKGVLLYWMMFAIITAACALVAGDWGAKLPSPMPFISCA